MTSAGLVIRDVEEADLERVVELLVLGVVPGGPPSTEDLHDLAPYRAAWRAIADADDGGAVLVAALGADVIGV